jgi:hypothetical protein
MYVHFCRWIFLNAVLVYRRYVSAAGLTCTCESFEWQFRVLAYCDVRASTHLDGVNYIYDTEVHCMKIYIHNFLLIKCTTCMGKFRVMSEVYVETFSKIV